MNLDLSMAAPIRKADMTKIAIHPGLQLDAFRRDSAGHR
jgi:hypothetical protein